MSTGLKIGATLLIALGIGAAAGYVYGTRGVPFVGKYTEWSIGIYAGKSPLEIGPEDRANPVLTATDVSDAVAEFVADPFLIRNGESWFMFFEVLNTATWQGDIAVASSPDLDTWKYEKLVLDEDFHLSFPRIVETDGAHYMVPETGAANELRLYRATSFPFDWEFVQTLLTGHHADPVIFRRGGRWWLYSTTSPANDVLRLYTSGTLTGTWIEHPKSPIVYLDGSRARPAGSVLQTQDRLIRFAQDDSRGYGMRVRAFEVVTLTPEEYEERELDWSALSGTGEGWNAGGMHHIDLHELPDGTWVAAVDGWQTSRRFRLDQ